MKHSEIRARLSDYLRTGSGPAKSAPGSRRISRACAPCGSELHELRATVSLLRRLPEPAHPPGLGDAVMARIARGEGRAARVVSLLRRAAEPRFAAPLAAGLAGLFLLFQTGDAGLSTPPSRAVAPETLARIAANDAATAVAAERGGFDAAWSNARDSGARTAGGRHERLHARRGLPAVPEPGSQRRVAPPTRLQEFARQLRGAGHPYSASLASHFEARPNVVLADWQPR